jgi:hypothetical protein
MTDTSSTERPPVDDGNPVVMPVASEVPTQPVVVVTVQPQPVADTGPSAEFWAIFSLTAVVVLSCLGLFFHKMLSKTQ